MSLSPDYTWHILVFALLTTLSMTVVGLLAVWIALGRGHWFGRVVAVAAIFSLLLFVPAYEPLIISVVQLLVAVPVLGVARRWRARHDEKPVWQFGVSDLLLLTLVVAMLVAVGTSVPGRIWQDYGVFSALELPNSNPVIPAWSYYLILGVTSGLLTVVATWIVLGRCRRWIRQIVSFVVVVPATIVIVGVVLEKGSLWPRQPPVFAFVSRVTIDEIIFLMAVISIVPLVVWLWLLGASQIMRRREDDVGRLPWRHCFARVALAAWSLILLAPLIWAYCVIVAPPIPETVLPDPNGHTELVALGKRLDATIPDHDPTGQRATQQDYLDFEQQHRELFVAASNAVELPSSVPLQYDFSDMDILMDRVQHIRHLARGLAAAGKSQHIQGKHDEAVRSHVDIIRLGRSVGRGGLIVDWLVGIAIEGMGTHALSADRNRIPATQRRELIETLRKLGEDGELPELVQRRDEIWSMHAFGWPGRIVNRINAFSGQNAAWFEVYHGAANRGRAYHRILLVELALQNYHDARGYYPETLDELMPEELDELPVDPFTGEPLQYRVTGQGFIVYSVGPNRQDDAGATPGSQPSGDDVRFEP